MNDNDVKVVKSGETLTSMMKDIKNGNVLVYTCEYDNTELFLVHNMYNDYGMVTFDKLLSQVTIYDVKVVDVFENVDDSCESIINALNEAKTSQH